MKNVTVIIGAGVSGLLVGREMTRLGAEVIVLEKSRGLGGRLATKRVGPAVFDQGAQFLTTRDGDGFGDELCAWVKAGIATSWNQGDVRRWTGRPSMNGVGKWLAEDVDVRREHKVTAVRHHDCGCWELDVEGEGMMRAERLVLSAPVPQSLALLDAGGVELPPDTRQALGKLVYHPCLALLVALDGPSEVPSGGVAMESGPLRWVADNAKKGTSPPGRGAITLHTTPEFSAAHYGASVEEIAEHLLPVAAKWFGGADVLSTTLHRWRFSEPAAQFEKPCLWLPDLALGFCGDAFGGPRVGGAVKSGLAMAEVLSRVVKRP